MIRIENKSRRPGRKRPIPLFNSIPRYQVKEGISNNSGDGILQISGETFTQPEEATLLVDNLVNTDRAVSTQLLENLESLPEAQHNEIRDAEGQLAQQDASDFWKLAHNTVGCTPVPPQSTPALDNYRLLELYEAAMFSPRPTTSTAFPVDSAGTDGFLPSLEQKRAITEYSKTRTPSWGVLPNSTSKESDINGSKHKFPGLTEVAGPSKGGNARPQTTLPPYMVRSTADDVERLPAIHPSVWSARGEKRIEYRAFISAPPVSATPPTTAAARRGLQLNSVPIKKPKSSVKKKTDNPSQCWRCALHLDHVKCEKKKYIRIGGGYRHGYTFVKEIIERAKEEQNKKIDATRQKQLKILQEKLAWRVGADGKRERRIKTFVRTKSGRMVVKYQYVSEDVYDEMVKLRDEGGSDSAKRRLREKLAAAGIEVGDDDDQLLQWDSGSLAAEDVAFDEDGNPMVDEFGEPILLTEVEKIRKARRRKEGKASDDSEAESRADSGLAFDEKEERARRRGKHGELSDSDDDIDGVRRQRRTKGGYGDEDSDEGELDGHKKGRKKKGKDGDSDGSDSMDLNYKKKKGKKGGGKGGDSDSDELVTHGKRGKKKGKGKRDGDADSAYSGDSKTKKKKGRRGKKGGKDEGSDSDDGEDGGGRKKRGKKGKKGHRDDDSDDSDGGHRRGKGRKKKGKGGNADSSDDSDGASSRRGKKKGKKGRGKGHSSDDSDEVGEDGKKKHRKHRHRGSGRRGSGSDSDFTDGTRRKKGGRRRRKKDGDGSEDSEGSVTSGGRRKHKHRHRRKDGEDGEGSDYSNSSRSRSGSRRKSKHRSRRRGSMSDYGSGSSRSDDEGGGKRRKHKKHRRGKHRDGSYSDGGSSGSDSDGRRRKHKKHRSRHRRRGSKGGDDDMSNSDYSSYHSDESGRSRRRRRKKKKHRRHHSSDEDSGVDYRRRHRSRRHGDDSGSDSYYSDDSDRSRRRRRKKDKKHRRHRDDSGSDYSSEDSRERRRRRRQRRRERRGEDGSDYSSDSSDRSRRRRRKKKHRNRSYSSDSYSGSSRSRSRRHKKKHHRRRDYSDSDSSDRSRRRHKKGKHRKHRRRSYSDSDSSYSSRGGRRRHRRHRRRSYSDSDSDSYSSDDSRDRRHRRHRRKKRYSDDSSDSYSSSDDSRSRRHRRRDRRHRRYSSSTEESSAGEGKSRRRKKDKRRGRHRYSSDSESGDSDYSRRRQKKKKPPRPPSTESSLSSAISSAKLNKMSKKERRAYERRRREKEERLEKKRQQQEEYDRYVVKQEKRKERERRRNRGEVVSSSSSDEYSFGDGRTAVKYGKGSRRDRKDKYDDRDIGYDDPNDPWKPKKRRDRRGKEHRKKAGDGSGPESSEESEYEPDPRDPTKMRKKEKTRRKKRDSSSESEESIYEDVFNEDGTVERKKIRMPKKKGARKIYDDDELDAESEYDSIGSADADKLIARQIYGKDGEVIRLTRSGRRIKDGKISKEVFDLDKYQQKQEKQKRDKAMLEKSYEEEYVEEFLDDEGQVVRVVKKRLKGVTAPGKRPSTPLLGVRRVNVLFLKGGSRMQRRLEQLLAECPLNEDPRYVAKRKRIGSEDDEGAMDLDERDGTIDYLAHYRLVNPNKLEGYGKAFLVEDTDSNFVLSAAETKVALEGVPNLQGMKDRQLYFILKMLGIDEATRVTFKMFAVIAALAERFVEVIDEQTKQWMEIDDLMDIERKIGLYRAMFYWNVSSDRSSNFIKASSLRVELIAGGLSREQEEFVMEKVEKNEYREVSFLDYMAFVPLFLCTHENILDNPLDFKRDKFTGQKEEMLLPQRDMVPLGRLIGKVSATQMQSYPLPYVFEQIPGPGLRKRIRVKLPEPPVDEKENNSDISSPPFSPVPPKITKPNKTKLSLLRR